MQNIKVYRKGERVLIEVEVVGREFKDDEVRYTLKDTRTGKVFDYTYGQDELAPVLKEEKPVVKKTTEKAVAKK